MGKKEFMRVFIWLLSLQDILVNFKIRWEQNSPNRFAGKNTGCFRNELCGQNHPQFAAIKNTFTTPLMTCIFVML